MDLPNLILAIGAGLGLILLGAGVVSSLVGRRTVVEERLGRYAETGGMVMPTAEIEVKTKQRRTTALSDFLNRLGEGTDRFSKISRTLARADIKLRPAEYIAAQLISAVLVALVAFVLGKNAIFAIVGLVLGYLLPQMYVSRAQKGRLKMFDQQLGDMLNLVVNGLRAGYSTLQAMEAVSRELPPPICDEFRRVVQEMQLGLSMEDALDHLLRRIQSEDLDLVITAVNVQREVGGNLAEILDTISFVIRERVRIKGEIAALTAQGRATAWVISGMPIALFFLLLAINPEYIKQPFKVGVPVFMDSGMCGIAWVCISVGLVGTGFAIVQKMVKIDI
ncbi:MAG: type II secretion system F family protein [Anaerolineales bacterium]|nr:type II secretion system F family protein [Anaerolineales bacterium]